MATKVQAGKRKIPPVTMEDATLCYKNFSGAPKRFNAKGLRNFHIVLDDEFAHLLEQDGWNVKWHEPKPDQEGEPAWPSIKINVRFDPYPPKIWLITKKGRTPLDEEMVGLLDDAEIKNVDLVFTASTGVTTEGKPYVKAYLSKMFVELDERDLEVKYAMPKPSRNEDED
jgi:hypothetical protein